jgi:pectin methylesterase-like acyl-CoA thioesterase
VVITLIVCASFVVVVAKSSYMTSFNTLYGTDNKTLDTCVTCHGSSYSLNSYAADFNTKRVQLGSSTAALQAIESWDSDNDGDTNLTEIEALTFPGNPASNVPAGETGWGQIKALYQ